MSSKDEREELRRKLQTLIDIARQSELSKHVTLPHKPETRIVGKCPECGQNIIEEFDADAYSRSYDDTPKNYWGGDSTKCYRCEVHLHYSCAIPVKDTHGDTRRFCSKCAKTLLKS
jgi:hypothetical protein